MKLKPYPKYKQSGVEWLVEVPENWNVLALKHVVSMQSGEQITAEDIEPNGDYPVFGGNGLRGYTSAFTHDGFYALVGRQGALCGNVNYAKGKFWASEHAVVVTPLLQCSTVWLGELLRAMNLGQYSMTAAQPGLSVDAIGKLRIPLPSQKEQAAIATFLERETAKIDSLIAKQEGLIELLQEKRQAVISHAVTKGLDPAVPMKPSGVEWLGDVPAHWVRTPIKHVLHSIIDSEHKTAQFYDDGNYMVVRTSNIKNGTLVLDDAKYTDLAGYKEWTIRGRPEPLDIIFTREAPAGEACIVPSEFPVCLGQRTVLMKADRKKLNPYYGLWSIYGGLASEFVKVLAQGSTVPHFNMSDIGNIPILLPALDEQAEIVAFLNEATAKIDTLIAKAQQAIELQKEHRTALISAAVTGKIDVRGLVQQDAYEEKVA